MKTNTIPALTVELNLLAASECELCEHEFLSNFLEASIRANNHQKYQRAFIARGMASRDEAKCTGEYSSAKSVLVELDLMRQEADV